jgi:hypothetical protein
MVSSEIAGGTVGPEARGAFSVTASLCTPLASLGNQTLMQTKPPPREGFAVSCEWARVTVHGVDTDNLLPEGPLEC